MEDFSDNQKYQDILDTAHQPVLETRGQAGECGGDLQGGRGQQNDLLPLFSQ